MDTCQWARYQAADICFVPIVPFLFRFVPLEKRKAYQADVDSSPVRAVALSGIAFAGLPTQT